MKLFSVSLVVTTLAAIAGSAIAAPGPLHARALDTVNSLGGRDVDINGRESDLALLEREVEFVDELSTRDNHPHHEGAGMAAKAHGTAASAWKAVVEASQHRDHAQADMARENAKYHTTQQKEHQKTKVALIKGEASDVQKSRASKWDSSVKDAWDSELKAKQLLGFDHFLNWQSAGQ